MIAYEDQMDLFRLVSRNIKRDLECYAFGGTAMMFYGYNDETKDIDLLFDIGHIEEEISQHSETYKCNQWYMLKSQSIDPQFYPIVKQVCKKLDSEQKDTYINRIKIKSDIITTYNVFARKAKNGINVSVNTTFNPLNSSSDFKYRAVSLGLIENSILRYIDDYLNKK